MAGQPSQFLLEGELDTTTRGSRRATIVSDPGFSHWVIIDGRFVGEAQRVKKVDDSQSFAFVRLFAAPATAGFGRIPANQLLAKQL
jgi:hypothetical protein